MLDTARFHQSRDYLAPGAEEIDAQPVRSGRHQKARYEVHATTRSGTGWPDARRAQTTDMPSARVR